MLAGRDRSATYVAHVKPCMCVHYLIQVCIFQYTTCLYHEAIFSGILPRLGDAIRYEQQSCNFTERALNRPPLIGVALIAHNRREQAWPPMHPRSARVQWTQVTQVSCMQDLLRRT